MGRIQLVTMSSTPTAGNGTPNSTVLNSRYRLLGTLAAGGMATVFKGQDTLLNRLVAIKILRDRFASDPRFVQRFREEAQSSANLNHPNIVTTYDVGRDVVNGIERHYIVMELIEGQDLKQAIRTRAMNGDAFSVDEAVSIGRQICEGVAYAHRRGLAHCDLKPQNVMLASDGRVKVTDFGIARAYTATLNTGERNDVVWGTPQYFAPEQASGGQPTPASDVYSIGVMLYEMLAGRLPFESRDPRQLAQLHQTGQPPPLNALNPNVTPSLESIVMRALAKDPAQRYPSADGLARALAAYAMQGDEQTMVDMPPIASARPSAGTGSRPAAPAPAASAASTAPRQAQWTAGSAPRPIQPKRNVITDTVPTMPTRAARDSGPDPLLWLVGAIAFLCVLGLIPLYFFVYRAYSAPPGTGSAGSSTLSSDNPSITQNIQGTLVGAAPISASVSGSTVAQVKVPQLIGKAMAEAERDSAAMGLKLAVVEERASNVYTLPTVLEQRIAPDTLVTSGTTISIVVSQVDLKRVPTDLIGRVLDAPLSQTLSALGVPLIVTDAIDFAPEGTILYVQPPGNTQLMLSDTLTVTVSNSGRIDLNAQMQSVIVESVFLPRDHYTPGQSVQFTVRYRATGPVGRDYKVGWYLFSPDGMTSVAQGADRGPLNHGVSAPTSLWQAGTIVDDTYTLRIPDNQPRGTYSLQLGLYSGPDRLPVTNPGTTTASHNLVLLRVLHVD